MDEKKDIVIPIITIFFVGVIAGAGWGVGSKLNLDPDDDGLTSVIARNTCSLISTGPETDDSCSNLLLLLTTVSIFAGLVSIFSYVKLVGDWKIGILIYAVSWLFGYLYIMTEIIIKIF